MTSSEIIAQLPYQPPFLFVDEILHVDENSIRGAYTYDATHDFYTGHFKGNPVTPGVILTETAAQIGLVALGIYLMQDAAQPLSDVRIALTSTEMDFFVPVFPGERVTVHSEKVYFRFQKLKCKTEMYNAQDQLVCRGMIAGMMDNKKV